MLYFVLLLGFLAMGFYLRKIVRALETKNEITVVQANIRTITPEMLKQFESDCRELIQRLWVGNSSGIYDFVRERTGLDIGEKLHSKCLLEVISELGPMPTKDDANYKDYGVLLLQRTALKVSLFTTTATFPAFAIRSEVDRELVEMALYSAARFGAGAAVVSILEENRRERGAG